MTNYVPINNTISHDIVRCFNSQYWSRFMHKRVGLVFDKETHCFQSYNQLQFKVTEKLVIIR